jgi:GT2 family glycosyltransferase
MVLGIATRGWKDWQTCVSSWVTMASAEYPAYVVKDKTVLEAFQEIYENTQEPVIALCHDDTVNYEQDWDKRILRQFDDPQVGLAGVAGGLGHGLPQMYEQPFHIPNLIRREFLSNMRDAERHGHRFAGECDVAVLDGLALFVRRSVLDKWGGWPVAKPVSYFMYSENLCCEVRRQGLRIRLVGIDCLHLGGKSSGTALPFGYEEEHRYFYEHNRDVMPYTVDSSQLAANS